MEPGKDPETGSVSPTGQGDGARKAAADRGTVQDRWPSLTELHQSISATQDWLIKEQSPAGYWCAELQGDTILESETILLLSWLGEQQSAMAQQCARYLLEQQQEEGGWGLFPGGEADISVSVKAYFALKLTGHAADDPRLVRACDTIRRLGGADRVNSFTRYYLALLGQIPYSCCPAVPPEAVLLPHWMPINIYRVSAWSRTILVPLSLVWAHQPRVEVPADQGIAELMLTPPAQWPATGLATTRTARAWRHLFLGLDRVIQSLERWRCMPLRKTAIRHATTWMLERFRDSDGLGAIYPPIVWSWIALRCLGYADDSPEVTECRRQLTDLVITENNSTRLQPCKSPVWDTAITLRALGRTSDRDAAHAKQCEAARERAIAWLLDKEIREPGDWTTNVKAPPAGWCFEHRNVFYPDTDDTAMVILALRDEVIPAGEPQGEVTPGLQWLIGRRAASLTAARGWISSMDQLAAACRRGCNWLLAMQNRDGGWGAFDRNNDAQFLCHVPFADHNAMIDPSTPDLTGRVVEALAAWGVGRGEKPMTRALNYLRRTQESDGSWPGRWGVNYLYGTWQVLVGLRAAGVPIADPSMQSGARWLFNVQQSNGGWGESPRSYAEPDQKGIGTVTPSQTAWALLGLMAAGHARSAAVRRGVQTLLDTQNPDGTWDEHEFTGTGFPLVFYLRYHYYRIYFPLLALRTWQYSVGNSS